MNKTYANGDINSNNSMLSSLIIERRYYEKDYLYD